MYLHPSLSCVAASVFLQLYLKPVVTISFSRSLFHVFFFSGLLVSTVVLVNNEKVVEPLLKYCSLLRRINCSVVALEESPCPWGPFTSPCPGTTSPYPCPWTTKSSKIVKDFACCKQSFMYDHIKSINSVTVTVHEDTVKNGLLTDVIYYLLIYVSK